MSWKDKDITWSGTKAWLLKDVPVSKAAVDVVDLVPGAKTTGGLALVGAGVIVYIAASAAIYPLAVGSYVLGTLLDEVKAQGNKEI